MDEYNNEEYQAYISFLQGNKPEESEEEKSYKADMHIHSEFSFDSGMKLDEIIANLKEKKVLIAGIADHIEFGNEPTPDVIDKIKRRNALIDELAEKSNITILKGIEVAEPHNYPNEMECLNRIPDLDYIIGSIHHLKGKYLSEVKNKKNIANKYLKETLKMVRYSDIDILGHIDYLKRYKEFDGLNSDLMYEILEAVRCSNLALEINTSGIRRCGETFPGTDILEEYTLLGGERVTLGSDAHVEDELYDAIKETSEAIKPLRLSQGIYVNRSFKSI